MGNTRYEDIQKKKRRRGYIYEGDNLFYAVSDEIPTMNYSFR